MKEKLSCFFQERLAILPDLWYDITVNIKPIDYLQKLQFTDVFVMYFSLCVEMKREVLRTSQKSAT